MVSVAQVVRSPKSVLIILAALLLTATDTYRLVLFSSSRVLAQTVSKTGEQLLQQGNSQYQAGQFEAALESWRQARKLYQQSQNIQGEGKSLANLGTVYVTLERYKETIATLETYLPIARSLNDKRGEAQALSNLGIAYEALGGYGKALEAHRQAGRILRAMGDRQGLGQALLNLGNVFEAIGDYSNAIIAYQQSLRLAQQTSDRAREGVALGNLGIIHANLGQQNEAIAAFERSLEIARSTKNQSGEASTLINLGSVYQSQKNQTKALGNYRKALQIAQVIGDRQRQSEALGSLGLIYEDEHQYPQAIKALQESLAIARTLNNPALEGTALNNLGHALFSAGRLAEAESRLQAAIQLLDSLRFDLSDTYQVSIFDIQIQTYNLLQQVRIAENKSEAALEASEQGRARAFAELLARTQEAGSRCQETGGGCQGAGKKGQGTENKEQRAIPQRSTPNPQPPTLKPIQISEIKQIAREQNATLVEYSIVPDDDFKFRGKQRARESELFIWVVSPTGKIAFRRIDLKPLWQKGATLTEIVRVSRCLAPGDNCGPVAQAIRGIGVVGTSENGSNNDSANRDRSRKQPGLRKLHDLLIRPIADLLPNDPNAHIIFIPQESLFLVPFAALQDPNGKYLIEKHTLLTAASIQVLALTRQQQLRDNGRWALSSGQGNLLPSLVVGNPTMPSIALEPGQPPRPLAPLPGAEQEATQIASLLQTKALIGEQASKAIVINQMANARIIHLATHGLLEYGSQGNQLSLQGLGVPGAIALAPDIPTSSNKVGATENNGLLTAAEILHLNLKAELVVLSACNTGQGRITGDGVIGLSRAFASAGVPNVVVSLWSVPDTPTAELMTTFYRNLKTNPNKAKALREAMLGTMQTYPRPYDWAAFVLIGAGR
jgi:CHAT domain-containing protein/tetratricopeptide (TPR) repeat protein